MGFILNDVIILAKNAEHLKKRNSLFTFGNPTSHVNYKDLKFVLNKRNLKKFNINENNLNNIFLDKVRKSHGKELVSFEFFSKLLNFKNFYSLDIDPNENPTFCLDITNENLDEKFISKADMIYDSGSLGYTNNPVAALNFLVKLLKNDGIIVHQSSHNGFIKTGYFQFNSSFFFDYYKENNLSILSSSFVFFSTWVKKILKGKWKIDIYEKPKKHRLISEKNSIYFVVKKNNS